jgi:hypothetical protein
MDRMHQTINHKASFLILRGQNENQMPQYLKSTDQTISRKERMLNPW